MAQASAEKLDHTEPAKKKSLAIETAVGKYARAAFFKRKRNRAPDRKGGESQGERKPHLCEREGDQSGSMKRKGWTPQSRKADFNEKKEGKQEEPP